MYATSAEAKRTRPTRTTVDSMTNTTEIVNVTMIATMAIVFARTVKPSPARQSLTMPPKRRLLTSQ